jgi:hypothetical protein
MGELRARLGEILAGNFVAGDFPTKENSSTVPHADHSVYPALSELAERIHPPGFIEISPRVYQGLK